MKYEYMIEKFYPMPIRECDLNCVGQQGWELTSSVTFQEHNLITPTFIYYFKREILTTLEKEHANDTYIIEA